MRNETLKPETLRRFEDELAELPSDEPLPGETFDETESAQDIEMLAKLDLLTYGRERKSSAKRLGISATLLDKIVVQEKAKLSQSGVTGQGKPIFATDPELLAAVPDGAELLHDLEQTFSRHLTLPDGAATVLALWRLFSHCHDSFQISPLLAITSPEKGCGKSSVLMLLSALVRKPLATSNITGSALFRSVEQFQPTMLVDEGDTFFDGKDDLRGILNSGWLRSSAHVTRTVGENFEPKIFSTWCPKSIAAIGKLPGTIMDRSLEIRMRRQTSAEQSTLTPLRADRLKQFEPLRQAAWTWASAIVQDGALSRHEPEMPEGFTNRLGDNWRPLFTISDVIGQEWPERAREAAVDFASKGREESWGEQLLRDVMAMFDEEKKDRLLSADIVTRLAVMEDRPWPECRNGKPIDARWVAKTLGRYELNPRTVRDDDRRGKGYLRESVWDQFQRYCSPKPTNPEPEADGF
jgi:putative DNA primase/helicase